MPDDRRGNQRIPGKKIYCPKATIRCGVCGESFDADEDFFYAQRVPGTDYYTFHSPCKACNFESRHKLVGKPCLVQGCDQPRVSAREPRCKAHAFEYSKAYRDARKKRQAAANAT